MRRLLVQEVVHTRPKPVLNKQTGDFREYPFLEQRTPEEASVNTWVKAPGGTWVAAKTGGGKVHAADAAATHRDARLLAEKEQKRAAQSKKKAGEHEEQRSSAALRQAKQDIAAASHASAEREQQQHQLSARDKKLKKWAKGTKRRELKIVINGAKRGNVDKEKCAVCQELLCDMQYSGDLSVTRCRHFYHTECWLGYVQNARYGATATSYNFDHHCHRARNRGNNDKCPCCATTGLAETGNAGFVTRNVVQTTVIQVQVSIAS